MSLDKTLNTATNQRHYDYIADGEQALGFGWIGGEFGEALLNWS